MVGSESFKRGINRIINGTVADVAFSDQASETTFPVLPVVLGVVLGLAALIVTFTLLYIRQRRKEAGKYKHYSQIAKTAVQPPEFTVKTAQLTLTEKKKSPFRSRLPEKVLSSEESLSPLSSEEMFYDAQDKLEGRTSRSVSSREPSPADAIDEEYDGEEETYPDDHLGRVWFNLEYDKSAESLAITLVKARNLSPRGKDGKTCDPFVKLHILCPEEKHVAQSKYKRKTNRPTFNEMFYFNLPIAELQRCTLRLAVYDGYRASQQSVVGEVLFQLNELDTDRKIELYRDLKPGAESPSELGEIHISLSYYPTLDRLTIIVLRAANLRRMEPRGTDAYVKVTFSIGNKIIKTKKTTVHHGTRDPLFNESFSFTASGDDLGTGTLLVTIMHSRGGEQEDKLIGRVLLGGMMYARGTACEHWTEMMTNPRNMIKYWHTLTK